MNSRSANAKGQTVRPCESRWPPDGRRRALGTMIGAAACSPLLGGCATVAREWAVPDDRVSEEPSFVAPDVGNRPRVALVLSGGAARGFAHLGVLRLLEQAGLHAAQSRVAQIRQLFEST